MRGPGREERALVQLLRVARQKLDEEEARLADLKAAKASSETSLDWLAQAIRAEEEAANAHPQTIVEFKRFLEGAGEKRRALEATRARLIMEMDVVRDAILEAHAELKKLEHLVEINRRASARIVEKTAASETDALVAARYRRHGA